MSMRFLGRWTVRSLRAMTLAAVAFGLSAAASAQDADSKAGGLKKTFTKTTTFKLPIQMEDRVRATLKEVQLYVKSGNGDWVRQEAVSPTTPHFDYRVPADGEYWFSLVTVDKFGKATPADVSSELPALRVVVDTRAPVVEVQPGMGPDGGYLIRCNVVDTNADMNSLKAVVKALEGDRPLVAVQSGIYKISAGDLDLPIHVVATDLAGNVGSKEATGRELFGAVAPTSAPPMLPPIGTPNLPVAQGPFGSGGTPPVGTPPVGKVSPPPVSGQPIGIPPIVPPVLNPSFANHPPLPPVANPSASQPLSMNQGATVANYNPQSLPGLNGGNRPSRSVGNRQLINTTQAQIDYRLEAVGPSGIGKVEIYMTPDSGSRWIRLGEDADRRSPADIELPGEGLFGIRFVVTNGNGFGGKAPQPGDQPTTNIEVDTTPPFLQLRPVELNPASGAIDIRWTATDKNLGDDPISIFCRTTPDGAWQPIGKGIKNEGAYRWSFPRDLGQQFFIKVEATDLAGNVSRVETPNPIMLDTTVPTVDVVGVTGVSVRPR
ncbi:MAG: hypothetical protein U0744_04495 [Gemmataceae bacterium]